MNGKDEAALEEVRFHYPRKPWPLPVFCYVFPALLLWWFCIRHLPSEVMIESTFGLAFLTGIFIVCLLDPSTIWISWHGGVALDEDGITIGNSSIPWDKIEMAKPYQFLLWKTSMLQLKLEAEKVSFWSIRKSFGRGRRNTATLPAHPVTYRDVLPAILRVRPELEVSPTIRRYMQEPEKVDVPNRFVSVGVLAAAVAFLVVELWPFVFLPRDLRRLLFVFALPALHGLFAGRSPTLSTYNPRGLFLRSAVSGPALPAAAAFATSMFSGMLLTGSRVVLVTALVMALVAVAVAFMGKLTVRRQGIVAGIIIMVPPAVLLHAGATQWPATDITNAVSGASLDRSVLPMQSYWGRDGVHLCEAYEGLENGVLHLPDMSTRSVPRHDVAGRVVALSKRFLVRWFPETLKAAELWAYDFEHEEEFQLAQGDFCIGGQPLSPDGTKLAWLEIGKDDRWQTLRIWDLTTRREAGKATRPQPAHTRPRRGSTWPSWKSDDRLVLWGCSDQEVLAFHFDTRGQLVQTLRCPGRFKYILGLQDGLRLLRLTGVRHKSSFLTYTIDCVDMTQQQIRKLDGVGEWPHMVPGTDLGFRVRYDPSGRNLTRFNVRNLREEVVCAAPKGMELYGMSSDGALALFGPAGLEFLPPSVYTVCHIATGHPHTVRTGGMTAEAPLIGFGPIRPGLFPISPTRRWLFMSPFGFLDSRVFLFEIPPDWRGN